MYERGSELAVFFGVISIVYIACHAVMDDGDAMSA